MACRKGVRVWGTGCLLMFNLIAERHLQGFRGFWQSDYLPERQGLEGHDRSGVSRQDQMPKH